MGVRWGAGLLVECDRVEALLANLELLERELPRGRALPFGRRRECPAPLRLRIGQSERYASGDMEGNWGVPYRENGGTNGRGEKVGKMQKKRENKGREGTWNGSMERTIRSVPASPKKNN